jgi:hypothetical protein
LIYLKRCGAGACGGHGFKEQIFGADEQNPGRSHRSGAAPFLKERDVITARDASRLPQGGVTAEIESSGLRWRRFAYLPRRMAASAPASTCLAPPQCSSKSPSRRLHALGKGQ